MYEEGIRETAQHLAEAPLEKTPNGQTANGFWCEDLSASSLEEILGWQAANKAWNKDLRQRTNALVNNRLSNNISWSDYTAARKLTIGEAVECRRRAALLEVQIERRYASSDAARSPGTRHDTKSRTNC